MKLTEVLAISGQPGLFKFVAQGKAGVIVESLVDSRRFPVSGTAKVSALSDISIFTYEEDMALADVLQAIYNKQEGKEIAAPKKMSGDELKSAMGSFIENYDQERVHTSDMKKLFTWYNIMVVAGFTSFAESEEAGEENTETTAKEAIEKSSAPKVTAPKGGGAAKSGSTAKSKSSSKVRTIKAS